MSATPQLGRDARLFKGGSAIGYGKGISTVADAEMIKVYSVDALTPAVTGAGKQTFRWTCNRLFTDKTYIALLLAGTKFDLVFAPKAMQVVPLRLGRTVRFCLVNAKPAKKMEQSA